MLKKEEFSSGTGASSTRRVGARLDIETRPVSVIVYASLIDKTNLDEF